VVFALSSMGNVQPNVWSVCLYMDINFSLCSWMVVYQGFRNTFFFNSLETHVSKHFKDFFKTCISSMAMTFGLVFAIFRGHF